MQRYNFILDLRFVDFRLCLRLRLGGNADAEPVDAEHTDAERSRSIDCRLNN